MTTSTSLRINQDLVKQAKIYAVTNNTTLTKIVEEGIRIVLSHKPTDTVKENPGPFGGVR